jgi:23S rRNA pseudouridine1911/1915/1917 synthase
MMESSTLSPTVLFEDNHLIAMEKPGGLLVQGDKTADQTLLDLGKQYIKSSRGKSGNVFLAPCHRLDRPVSGVVLFACTSKAAGRVAASFRENHVKKRYLAIVRGQDLPTQGKLESWLIKDSERNMVTSHSAPVPGAREASTDYSVLAVIRGYALILLEPDTGRSHQLRVHCASLLGAPVVGDLRYGAPKGLGSFIALHSLSLVFPHPTKKTPIAVTSSPPQEWSKIPAWPKLSSIANEAILGLVQANSLV